MLSTEQLDKIHNVIVVMMENRSFDHAIGYLSLPDSGYANCHGIEGVRQALAQGYKNINPAGDPISPHPIDLFWNAAQDPPHERIPVSRQLGAPSAQGVFPMNGFVQSYYEVNGKVLEPNVVGYYQAEQVGTFDFFAKNFMVCDHWFAPLPTSAQPNRLMAIGGHALRDFTGNLPTVTDQHLVYDWLAEKQAAWGIYCDGNPFITVIPDRLRMVLSSAVHTIPDLDPAALRRSRSSSLDIQTTSRPGLLNVTITGPRESIRVNSFSFDSMMRSSIEGTPPRTCGRAAS